MKYLGLFSIQESFSKIDVYIYQKPNGSIQFVSSKAKYCQGFPSWEEAQLHIPTTATRYFDETKVAS